MEKLEITVLILILMEHAQRVTFVWFVFVVLDGLNPYFNGTCSKRAIKGFRLNHDTKS